MILRQFQAVDTLWGLRNCALTWISQSARWKHGLSRSKNKVSSAYVISLHRFPKVRLGRKENQSH